MSYASAKFEVALSNGLGGNAFTRKGQGGQCHMKDRPEPWTSCTLCSCKVWRCNDQWLRSCIYKKIHYLTLTLRSSGSRSHEMLPSTLNIKWPMHQQSLMLLHPTVKEKMHLALTLGSRSHKMLPSDLYIMWPIQLQSLKLLLRTVKEEIHLQEIHYLTLTLG